MNKNQAIERARELARQHHIIMAVVDDPVTNAEEEGTYGFCPARAVTTLFRFGKVVATVHPDGRVELAGDGEEDPGFARLPGIEGFPN